jgi:hypothetical protein
MYWVMGGAILWGVGILLRRVLGLGGTTSRRSPSCLDPDQKSFCDAIANEIESQSLSLYVSLNEALEELEAGNVENACELLELAEAQWLRLGEILSAVLRNIAEYLPLAHVVIPVRGIVSGQFRSRVMIDHLRLHELVDQFLFRTKLRFHLQVRILRQAVDILTADFRRAQARKNLGGTFFQALRDRLDGDYQDFDLIAKKTILACGKFTSWLPQNAAASFFLALRPTLDRSVRSTIRAKSETVIVH